MIRIDTVLDQGQHFVHMLYTFRSVSRAIPMVNINIPPDATPEERAELTSKKSEVNRQIVNILEPEIQKLRELMHFVDHAISIFRETMVTLATPEAREKVVPEGLYTAMIRMIDVMLKLDNLKDMKACLNNDFSRYKRALGEDTDDKFRKFISNEKQVIFNNLRDQIKQISGHEDVLFEILEQVSFNLHNAVYVTPDEMFAYLRVLPHLMFIIDGDPADPRGLNIFNHKSISKLQKLIRQYPVVPLYGDMPITLFYILCRIPHFDRSRMGERWGENPDQAALKFHNITNHWEGIKRSFNEFIISFTTIMNKVHRQPFSRTLEEENVAFASEVYIMVKDGFLRLSQWTKSFMQILAWKYSHPADMEKIAALNVPTDKPGHEYERALKYNFSLGEYNVIVDIISMIKSQAGLLLKAESKLAPILRFHIHHVIQQLVQADLLPLLHKFHKREKTDLFDTVQTIRVLAADWESMPTQDFKDYSSKQGKLAAVHQPRVVGPSHTQLQILRTQIRALYDEKSASRQKSGFFGRVELGSDDAKLFEAFYYDSFYYQYILNFSQTVREVSDLGDLWYREFFLEITRCVQFPIEMSFPWILTEHVISSKAIDIPIIEKILYTMDIYNDAAHRALYVLNQQFLYDEIEAEANLVFDQLVFLISDEMYTYYKNFAASNTIEKAYKIKNEDFYRSSRGDLKVSSLDVSYRRYHIPIGQRHIQLLGRSIDLNYLIGQHVNNTFYRDVESVIQKFESSDYAFIVELDSLLTVIRNTHALLSEFVEIDSFDFILSEVNESYGPVSFSNRISLHMTRTLTSGLFPNSLYNKDTERFVQSPSTLRPVEYDKAPKNLAPNMHYGSVCNKAYDQLGKMTRKFFGKPHLHSMLAVLKPTDLSVLIQECMVNFEEKLLDIHAYVEALQDGVQPCKLPQFLYKLGGCYGCIEKILTPILEYEDLKPEVFQSFREIGNTICFVQCLSEVIETRKCFGFINTTPFFGVNDDFNSFYSSDVVSTPFGSTLHNLLNNSRLTPSIMKIPSSLENVIETAQSLMSMCANDYENSQSLFLCTLRRIEEMMIKNNLLSEWTGPTPKNDALDVDNSPGFHRLWSTLTFLYCVQEMMPEILGSERSENDADQFGHGFAAAGCLLLHVLGQRNTFELLDFSYHVLSVHQHEDNTSNLQSNAKVGMVDDALQKSADSFVVNAKLQRDVQNHFFSVYENTYRKNPAPSIKVFHPPVLEETESKANVKSSVRQLRRETSIPIKENANKQHTSVTVDDNMNHRSWASESVDRVPSPENVCDNMSNDEPVTDPPDVDRYMIFIKSR